MKNLQAEMRINIQKAAPLFAFGFFLWAFGTVALSMAQPATNTPTATPTWSFCPTQVAGTLGSGNTQFNQPNGAAVYGTNLYISDYSNNRVEQYDTSLNWVQNIGVGQVSAPGQVAVDANGYLYVTNQGGNTVMVFNPSSPATPVLTFGSSGTGNGHFSNPIGLAVDTDGSVYVCDWNYIVQKFQVQLTGTPSATWLLQWGGTGSTNGKFNGCSAIAVDGSHNVYVDDTNNYRIQKFDSSGNYITQFGSNGTGLGQFQGSWGIQFGPCGNLYATDRVANFIQVFSSTGTALSQYGTTGSGTGQFDGIMGIAFDGSNNMFTTEYINNRLQKFFPCALPCAPTPTPTTTPTATVCDTLYSDNFSSPGTLSNYTVTQRLSNPVAVTITGGEMVVSAPSS
ncbi:MAG TPA: hypothetical protein VJ873_08505, partial [bacterium]|nr:hypothetical protein [bacterium]